MNLGNIKYSTLAFTDFLIATSTQGKRAQIVRTHHSNNVLNPQTILYYSS